jgi:hypothetical protein
MIIGFGGLSDVDTADTTASLAQADAATAQIAVDTKTPTINFLRLGFTLILLFSFHFEIDLIRLVESTKFCRGNSQGVGLDHMRQKQRGCQQR